MRKVDMSSKKEVYGQMEPGEKTGLSKLLQLSSKGFQVGFQHQNTFHLI